MRLPHLGVARLALLKRSGSADGALNAAPYDTAANPASVTTMHIIWSNHFDVNVSVS